MQENLLNYTGLTEYDGKIKTHIANNTTKIINVTQAQYDALTQAQKESGTYFITDANGGTYSADNCTYDNTDSNLTATNVQDAIDEVEDDKLDKNGGDSATCVTAFTSSDVADSSASSWTTVSTLATNETHASIFAKVSQMFKNIRYLYKMLGTTDISTIGDGTVTGAISTQNANFKKILCGHASVASVSANGYADIDVTFRATYSSTPVAVASIRSTGVVSNFKDITLSCYNETTSGFKIRIYNGTSSTLNLSANWIAVF